MPEGRCSSEKENWKKGNTLLLAGSVSVGGWCLFVANIYAKERWRMDSFPLCEGENK